MKTNLNTPCAVIVTALQVEYMAVRAHLYDIHEETDRGTIYEQCKFEGKKQLWNVGIVPVGSGNAVTAFEAERAIAYFQPQVAFFVGVAGGLKIKDVRLGDVVATTKVYGYESGKVSTSFQPRPDVGNSTYAMQQRARAEARKTDWLQRLEVLPTVPKPQVLVGPIASGEKVLASTRSATWRFLQKYYGDALAVEMEGHGFLKATHANQQVEALIIRGISDLIDDKDEADKAKFQEIASRHASAFAFEVLANFDVSDISFASGGSNKEPGTEINTNNQFKNYGSLQGVIQGGNSNTINNSFMTTPSPLDKVEEGRAYLNQGLTSLLNKNYITARQQLAKAVRYLQTEQIPVEHAHASYLQALALLGGERPFGITRQLWLRVEELMRIAITLSPCYSHLYTFAIFLQDFARNGWHKSMYLQQGQALFRKIERVSLTTVDDENIHLLWVCQLRLMQDTQQNN